jgi:hypothetical protein
MLYAGLDLSRKRLDFHLLDVEGATVEIGAARPIRGPLKGARPRQKQRPHLAQVIIDDRLATGVALLLEQLAHPLARQPRILPATTGALLAERIELRRPWHGDYYALEVMRRLGLEPGGAVRVGIVHYNTAAEVDRLLAELDRVPG